MDEWNTRQHGRSDSQRGCARVRSAEREAELATLAFLREFVPAGRSPMCGNSICQDRRFLARCMPELERYFHYRNLDVSTLKELARRWSPPVLEGFTKDVTHLAMADVRDSIRELQHYREHFMRKL